MNRRGFLIFRMLVELALCVGLMIAAVDVGRVHISDYLWLDIPCRLLFAAAAIGIFVNIMSLQRDVRA